MDTVKTYQEVQEKDELVDAIVSNLMLYQRKYSQLRKERRRNFRQRLKEEQKRLHKDSPNQQCITGTQFLEMLVSQYKRLDKSRVVELASKAHTTNSKKTLENWIWYTPKKRYKKSPNSYHFEFVGTDEVKLRGYKGPMAGAYLSDEDDIHDPDDFMIDYKEDALTFYEDTSEEETNLESHTSEGTEDDDELGRLLQDADKTLKNKQIHKERQAAMEKLEKDQISKQKLRQRRKRLAFEDGEGDEDEDELENNQDEERLQPSRKRQRTKQNERHGSRTPTRNKPSSGATSRSKSKSKQTKQRSDSKNKKDSTRKQQRRISNQAPERDTKSKYLTSDTQEPHSPLLSSSPSDAVISTSISSLNEPSDKQSIPPSPSPSPSPSSQFATPPNKSQYSTTSQSPIHTPSPNSGLYKLLVTVKENSGKEEKYVLKTSANTINTLINDIENKVGESIDPDSVKMLEPEFQEWVKFSMEDLPTSAKVWAECK